MILIELIAIEIISLFLLSRRKKICNEFRFIYFSKIRLFKMRLVILRSIRLRDLSWSWLMTEIWLDSFFISLVIIKLFDLIWVFILIIEMIFFIFFLGMISVIWWVCQSFYIWIIITINNLVLLFRVHLKKIRYCTFSIYLFRYL